MNKGPVAILLVLLLAWGPAPAGAAGSRPVERMYYFLEGETAAPVDAMWVLDSNATAGLGAYLVSDRYEGLHAGEPLNLTVWWVPSGQALNATVTVGLGVDALWNPETVGEVCLWGTDPSRSNFTADDCLHYSDSVVIAPDEGDRTFMAQLTYDGSVLNLSRTLAVGPARTLQTVRLVLPAGHDSLPEQSRADVHLDIENGGGYPAMDQVIDVRYAGLIVTTRSVPLVPALGNCSVPLTFTPVYGATTMEVYVVAGPGAPYRLAVVDVPVRAAAVLSVESLSLGVDQIDEGSVLHLSARVANRGNATASDASVQFFVDGAPVANSTLSGLGPGSATTANGSWRATDPGLHAVSARISGSSMDAQAASVRVTAQTPGAGTVAATLSLVVAAAVTLAARRSARAPRA